MRIKVHIVEKCAALPKFAFEVEHRFAIVHDGEDAFGVAYNTFWGWVQDCHVNENDYNFWYEVV